MMKKKWLLAFFAATACIAGAIGLTACGETEHRHDWTEWSVTETPQLAAPGKATRTCNNANCDAEAGDKEYELPAILTCEDYIKSNDSATCTEGGEATYTYNVAGVSVSFEAESSVKPHTEEVVPGVAAGCTEDGLTDGKKCSVCGITLEEREPIDAHHTEEVVPGVAAGCTEDGLTDGKKCSVCGITLEEREPIAAHHTEEVVPGEAATCTEGGLTDGKKCSVCGITLEEREPIDALGHTEEVIPAVDASCFEDGLTDGKKCSVCGEILEAQETVAAHHTAEVIPAVKATCEDTGLTDGKKCSICGEILEAQRETIPTGHSFDADPTLVPNEGEGATGGTLTGRCSECSKTIVYKYDNTVTASDVTAIGKAVELSSGVNYVYQKDAAANRPSYLKYTFTEAGTYTIYWVNLNSSTFYLAPATITGSTSSAFITSKGELSKQYITDAFVSIEGYLKSSLQYYVDQVATTSKAGEYVVFTKESLKTSTGGYQNSLALSNLVPEKLTLTVEANTTLSFRNYTNSTDARYFLISIDKEDINEKPAILAEYCAVGAGNVSVKNSEFEFVPITEETAGTYTFTAGVGTFQLYINDILQSDGEKDFFGYADFRERYLTVTLQAGDVVKVVKTSKRASEKVITIKEGAVEEPGVPTYNGLVLGDQTITLSDKDLSSGSYENESGDAPDKFYSFTASESGYYEMSVADDVRVTASIRVDKTHYTVIFDVSLTKKHSGVFYAEAGQEIIIAFFGNDVTEFNVNIAPGEEPIITLEANEKLEGIAFMGLDTFIKITVGDSVAEGTYLLTFKASPSLQRSYIYFSVNEEIEVDDKYDNNALADAYVNADIEAGANNTVGAGTKDKSDWDEDYVRTVTLKAGDVIYLATTSVVSGLVDITLTPVEE